MGTDLKHGDFTGLAENYARYRAGYCESVLRALLALVEKPISQIDAADIGAGTGIWTTMVARHHCRSLVAVEPNDDMRKWGAEMTQGLNIEWHKGTGDATGLKPDSIDFLSMASSFHWVDFERGTREFARVLRPGGRFVAVWNPRLVEANPILADIEAQLRVLAPDLKRVSSGRSGITERLTNMLSVHPQFEDVVYVEGQHVRTQTVDEYIGAWRSVNDVQVQLGPRKFAEFLEFARERLEGMSKVETTYLTRAWAARRR
jgi:SAM-dependent methyltransferase